jgi:di/tricarboxylate transporter
MIAAARPLLAAVAVALLCGAIWQAEGLFVPARIALMVFVVTAAVWAFTKLNPAWTALVAVLVLAATGATTEALVFTMLGHDVIWLMIGAFVIGHAIEATGLAARLAAFVARRARSVRRLFWWTTALLVPLTFLIPSTSGRAATMLPLMRIVPAGEVALRRAYALLIPVVILLATSAALTGAGSHLVLEELLVQRLGERFGFGLFALWGVPFAVALSALACFAILRMFVPTEVRTRALAPRDNSTRAPFSAAELRTIAIVALTLALWLASAWHGLAIATVAIVAMLALTAPRLGVVPFKQAAKAINWQLILFVGAAMLLGRTLIDTQAAGWVMAGAFDLAGLDAAGGVPLAEWAVVAAVTAIAMASHLVVTSHVARAAALGPPMLLFAQTAGVDPVAVMFLVALGTNYCITLPVCSKALMVFQDDDSGSGGFAPGDLARLSLVLALPAFALTLATYYLWWKWTGLALT